MQDAPSAKPTAAIADLGGIADRENWAVDINDRGDVVGYGAFQSEQLGETRALLWTRDGLTVLPPLRGDIASLAEAINNRRQVVGHSIREPFVGHPVLWEEGRAVALEALPDQATGQAADINEAGVIVGSVVLHDSWIGQQRAVMWRNGKVTDLFPASVTFSSALAINNRGQVIGQAFGTMMVQDGNVSRSIELAGAYIWDRGSITRLGGLGGVNTIPQDINERGQITGMADNSGTGNDYFYRAFLWERGRIHSLGTLTTGHSVGLGMNNQGDVVGQADPGRGFLWRKGHMVGLAPFGADDSRAEAINNRGEVVGLGFDSTGRKHAVLWGDTRLVTRWVQVGDYD
jgi:probable HAF family extracellular repeat protein